MSNEDYIKERLEELKAFMYYEIKQLMQDTIIKDGESGLSRKFKPTKHQKSYKIERNYKKRCYQR